MAIAHFVPTAAFRLIDPKRTRVLASTDMVNVGAPTSPTPITAVMRPVYVKRTRVLVSTNMADASASVSAAVVQAEAARNPVDTRVEEAAASSTKRRKRTRSRRTRKPGTFTKQPLLLVAPEGLKSNI
ncbi:hypothetical protein LPJ57_007243 [Coemansia sp. RSA 486]|nr:hypothetical protein LPJ57_007243 [Coemansia sp. RSA 486]